MSSSNAPQMHALHVEALMRRADNKRFAELEADTLPTLAALQLDMKRTTYVGKKHDLIAYITDVDMGQRRKEAALLLCNARDPKERQVYVRLGELWILVDPSNVDEARNQAIAINALAERLYGFVTKPDAFKVLDAVYEFAQDLLHAKPPTWLSSSQWLQALAEDDLTFTFGGTALNG